MGQPHHPPPHERRLVALGRILQALRQGGAPDQLVQLVLDHVRTEFDYPILWVGRYDQSNHQMLLQGSVVPGDSRVFRPKLSLSPGDLMEQALIEQRPLIVVDLRQEPSAGEWTTIAQGLNIQSAILYPIRRKDSCIGLMLLGAERWGITPSAEERAHLSVLLGTLAEAWHQHDIEYQRQQQQHPDRVLETLLQRLVHIEHLDERLTAVVHDTHQLIQPSRSRVYWFEPRTNHFWLRVQYPKPTKQSRSGEPGGQPSATIQVQEARSFYQTLWADQLVVVGEAHSSLKAGLMAPLMAQMQAQSLIAAPIFCRNELVGALSVEGDTPRLWSEAEKRYMQTVSRLLGLAMPVAAADELIAQTQRDQQLVGGIVHSIHSDADWRKTLDLCARQLCDRTDAHYFLLLLHDTEHGGYEICYQSHGPTGRVPPLTWPSLDEVDWQMLERSQGVIRIEDVEHDLKLMAWRGNFQALGVQSLLVCNVSIGHAPEGLIIIGDKTCRHWSTAECTLLETVAQQIGLILHQWQLQRQMDQQGHVYEAIQWGLRMLQRTFQPEQLDAATTQHLANLLQVPAVVLVSWAIGEDMAQLSQLVLQTKAFQIDEDAVIPVASDAIINWALQTDGILPLTMADLPDLSRQWLSGPNDSNLLITALRTAPKHTPTAVLIVLAPPERRWTEYHFNLLTLIANQLAWARRHLSLTAMLVTQREKLEMLNWYKHRRFEEVYHQLEKGIQRLQALGKKPDALASQRFQQILRQLSSLLTSLNPLLQHEHWKLHTDYKTTPLISLLNRLMERVNPLIQAQQLWAKVHNESNLIIGGDLIKIEFILYELLASACQRSPRGGRIDVWCRQVDRQWLELSITDDGKLPPTLIDELNLGRPEDLLAPSALDDPPGLHLAICHGLMKQMGGDLSLSILDDQRILSRVLLPIANNSRSHRSGPLSPPGSASQPFSRHHGR
ncbi:Sensor histidine kinase [Halomicronema hongdechloris C2206]|uniref:Sensor histidine kinase n=1 Tax=Halomicronema hongdechloris C2206 TaxID=1641165 RepID=A0A1Z3HNB5_9CYAN|nr:GAF domain-containing protein [Halomicronema hongdechloris]ASC71803.1 Sensor histidine kinase [Halomicronema hongdechloris C2206]